MGLLLLPGYHNAAIFAVNRLRISSGMLLSQKNLIFFTMVCEAGECAANFCRVTSSVNELQTLFPLRGRGCLFNAHVLIAVAAAAEGWKGNAQERRDEALPYSSHTVLCLFQSSHCLGVI